MASVNNAAQQQAVKVRLAYVKAFNDTMAKIWRERLLMLKVIDTGALYRSVIPMRMVVNADATDLQMAWGFLEYGIYQERGTGREVPIGNPGDIGRLKVRQRRRWLQKSFYSSTMNLKEFMADSLGMEAMAIFSDALGNRKP